MTSRNIPLSKLVVSALNTRKDLDAGQEDSGIEELARSIDNQGLLNPLIVRPRSDGAFEVISGQRRLLACRKIGYDPVHCLVRDDLDDADATTVSLVENVHRADMNPIDKARALKKLYDELGTQQRVAEETGWSSTTVSKYMALLELPEELQSRVSTSEGAMGIAAMSRLARTFKGEDAVEAYEKVGGFNQRVQQEIIRRSKGNLDEVNRLVAEAQEGIFDVRRCGGAYGCEVIKEIIEGELGEEDFERIVASTAQHLGAHALEQAIRKSARDFLEDSCSR